MTAAPQSAPAVTRLALVLVAATIGVMTVSLLSLAKLASVGEAMFSFGEPEPFFLCAAVVATPFFLLAVSGITTFPPWLAGFLLTGLVWGYTLFDIITNFGTGRGANIGLGLILVASPFFTSAVCMIVAWKWETRSAPEV
jgi:hypothetical protein